MIHSTSGVVRASSFELVTGQLGVMASRHRSRPIVVSRDDVAATLEDYFPFAEQAVGRPDISGRGNLRNLNLWRDLADREAVVSGC